MYQLAGRDGVIFPWAHIPRTARTAHAQPGGRRAGRLGSRRSTNKICGAIHCERGTRWQQRTVSAQTFQNELTSRWHCNGHDSYIQTLVALDVFARTLLAQSGRGHFLSKSRPGVEITGAQHAAQSHVQHQPSMDELRPHETSAGSGLVYAQLSHSDMLEDPLRDRV